MEGGFQRRFWPEVMAGTYRGSRLQTLFISLVLHAYFKSGAVDAVTTWLSQTDFQKAKYVKAGIPVEKIEVLPPPRPAAPLPQRWEDEGYLLFLGRLVPEKGIGFLLDQWEKAEKEGDGSLPPLVIAGDGPLREEVERRAASVSRIRVVGEVKEGEKERLLSGCSGLVVPSEWWEVFGIVVLEAYEMEKPVLASRSGGLGEIVTPGVTGFQFEPCDGASFREAVARLMGLSIEQRRQMGREGRRWVSKHTDADQWTKSYSEIVQRTVVRKKSQGVGGK
jgi:glycosyltransferase involved in cell wall biosynthesis